MGGGGCWRLAAAAAASKTKHSRIALEQLRKLRCKRRRKLSRRCKAGERRVSRWRFGCKRASFDGLVSGQSTLAPVGAAAVFMPLAKFRSTTGPPPRARAARERRMVRRLTSAALRAATAGTERNLHAQFEQLDSNRRTRAPAARTASTRDEPGGRHEAGRWGELPEIRRGRGRATGGAVSAKRADASRRLLLQRGSVFTTCRLRGWLGGLSAPNPPTRTRTRPCSEDCLWPFDVVVAERAGPRLRRQKSSRL